MQLFDAKLRQRDWKSSYGLSNRGLKYHEINVSHTEWVVNAKLIIYEKNDLQ